VTAADRPIDLTGDVRDRPGRLAVGVVGTGRAGAVLGAALAAAGHRVVAVSAVSEVSRERAATLLPDARVLSHQDVCARTDLVLLSVPDDVLPELVAGLATTQSFVPGQLVAHCSGRHGLGVLEPATSVGALPLALHPVMTFTGTSVDLNRLAGAVFGVSAPAALLPIADALVIEMGGEPVHVIDEQRVLYHAALAHAANHLITLVAESSDLLRAAGVDDPARVLAPLLSAALDNALRSGDLALTGPVARGDAGTVAAHLAVLVETSPEAAATYRALARATAARAMDAGLLSPEAAQSLLGVINDESAGWSA
jgi:predicted short-subunit dehydrogenase-like oxidoreductase (DUF2520 family)